MMTVMMVNNRKVGKKGPEFVIRNKGVKAALIVLGVIGFAMSVAFPYGLGLVAFVALIAVIGAIAAVGYACYGLVKDMFGKTAGFGYTPTTAYMTGVKTRKKRVEGHSEEEEKK